MYASKTRKEKFSGPGENVKGTRDGSGNEFQAAGPATEKARRPNIECRCRGRLPTADGMQTADRRCWRRAMSEVWMQQSVMYCGALCCRRGCGYNGPIEFTYLLTCYRHASRGKTARLVVVLRCCCSACGDATRPRRALTASRRGASTSRTRLWAPAPATITIATRTC